MQEILPEEIESALKNTECTKNFLSIKEAFLKSLVYTHRTRIEKFHTELGRLYLNLAFHHEKFDYMRDFKDFLREPNWRYSSRDLIAELRELKRKHPGVLSEDKIPQYRTTEEETFLLGKSGQFQEAIEIYVTEVMDFDLAEIYCASYDDQLLTDLFERYMKFYHGQGGKGREKIKRRIHSFLKKYATHDQLDPIRVLELIPHDWPLNDPDSRDGDSALYIYLAGALSKSSHMRREKRVRKK